MKRNIKNVISKLNNFITKNESFKLILAPLIVSVFITISTLIINNSFNKFIKPKKQIVMGFTAHPTFEIGKHLNRMKRNISSPINQILGDFRQKYEFIPSIRGNFEYDELFESLYLKRIDLGFFSPYSYIEKYILQDERLNSFKYIGQKYISTGKYYYSGIVVPGAYLKYINYISFSDLEKYHQSAFNEITQDSITCILNIKENSTSTRVIPELIMRHKGIKVKDTCYYSRQSVTNFLLNSIDSSKIDTIGFMASDDWFYACEQDSNLENNYSFIYFDDFPIPYDPVFVNKYQWRKTKNKKTILTLLRQWIYTSDIKHTQGFKNDWIDNNEEFIKLILSGKVTDTLKTHKDNTLTISFLNNNLQTTLLKSIKMKDSCKIGFLKKIKLNEKEKTKMQYNYKFCNINDSICMGNNSHDLKYYTVKNIKNERANELSILLDSTLNHNLKDCYVIIPELENQIQKRSLLFKMLKLK